MPAIRRLGVSPTGPTGTGGPTGPSGGPTGPTGPSGPTGAFSGSNGAGTAVAGAVTLNNKTGVITTEALVAATGYTLTLTNSQIAVGSTILAEASDATGGAAPPMLISNTPGSGSAVLVFAMAALTGTFKIRFAVFN